MTRCNQYIYNAFSTQKNESTVFYEDQFAGVIKSTSKGWLCEDDQIFELYNDAYDHQAGIMRAFLLQMLEIA